MHTTGITVFLFYQFNYIQSFSSFSKPILIHLFQKLLCYRVAAAFADNRIYAAIRTKSRIFLRNPHFYFLRREYLQTIKAAAHRIAFKLLLVSCAKLVCFYAVLHVITFPSLSGLRQTTYVSCFHHCSLRPTQYQTQNALFSYAERL